MKKWMALLAALLLGSWAVPALAQDNGQGYGTTPGSQGSSSGSLGGTAGMENNPSNPGNEAPEQAPGTQQTNPGDTNTQQTNPGNTNTNPGSQNQTP
ncbi:MAG: hypothetical protein ACYDCL_14200 [Myxococcales bacterium]